MQSTRLSVQQVNNGVNKNDNRACKVYDQARLLINIVSSAESWRVTLRSPPLAKECWCLNLAVLFGETHLAFGLRRPLTRIRQFLSAVFNYLFGLR